MMKNIYEFLDLPNYDEIEMMAEIKTQVLNTSEYTSNLVTDSSIKQNRIDFKFGNLHEDMKTFVER